MTLSFVQGGLFNLRHHVKLCAFCVRSFSDGRKARSTVAKLGKREMRRPPPLAEKLISSSDLNAVGSIMSEINREKTGDEVAYTHDKLYYGAKARLKEFERVMEFRKHGESLYSYSRTFPYLNHFAKGNSSKVKEFCEAIDILVSETNIELKDIDCMCLKKPDTIQFRIKLFEELGIPFRKKSLLHCRTVMLSTEQHLKDTGAMPRELSIIDSLLSLIKCEPTRSAVASVMASRCNATKSIFVLKNEIILEYLKIKMQNEDKIIFNIYDEVNTFTFSEAIEMVDIMSREEATRKHLQNIDWNAVLCELAPDLLEELLIERRHFLGKHIVEFFRRPSVKIFSLGTHSLDEKLHFLTKSGFTEKQIASCAQPLLVLKLSTIRKRLFFWFRALSPELVKADHLGPKLITHFLLAKYNFEHKRSYQHMLSVSSLLKPVRVGKNRSPKIRETDQRMIRTLCTKHGWDVDQVTDKLLAAPGFCYLNFENCTEIIRYLTEERDLNLQQISAAPYILLYQAFYIRNICTEHAALLIEWRDHPSLCDYIVYLLEREYNFHTNAQLLDEK